MASSPSPHGPLTDKQRVFVSEYCKDFNAHRAAVAAGVSEKSARQRGYRWLQTDVVRAAVVAEIEARNRDNRVTVERVLRELARIAFADIRTVVTVDRNGVALRPSESWSDDEAAAVAEVRETTTQYGGSVSAKMHNKIEALNLLGKHLGLWTDRLDLGINVDLASEFARDVDKVYGPDRPLPDSGA